MFSSVGGSLGADGLSSPLATTSSTAVLSFSGSSLSVVGGGSADSLGCDGGVAVEELSFHSCEIFVADRLQSPALAPPQWLAAAFDAVDRP